MSKFPLVHGCLASLHLRHQLKTAVIMESLQARKPPCQELCTQVIAFMEGNVIPANTGISIPPYHNIDGFRYINIYVEFEQIKASEAPVSLGVIFALDSSGFAGARCYVNFESNIPSSQPVNFINVDGGGTWHGSPHNKSSYVARFPVMGPFVQVFPFNKHTEKRKVSIKAYLTT